MLAKIWKKLGLLILIIACLFNIISKLTTKLSFDQEIQSSADYVKTIQDDDTIQGSNNTD